MIDLFKKKSKKYQDIDAKTFEEGTKSKDAVIIDVRSSGELQSGRIKGARNIDIMQGNFLAQIKALPKDKAYYLYCRSGNRSGRACEIMSGEGFEKVYNLSGGIMRWPFGTV